MLTKVKELKIKLSELHTVHASVVYINNLRTNFIKDPVSTVEEADPTKGISESIVSFREVFKLSDNLDLATVDALTVINTSLVTKVEELLAKEVEVTAGINALIDDNKTVSDRLLSDVTLIVTESIIEKAKSSLPFAELFEKVLLRNTNNIMGTLGVSVPDYIGWLYGIAKDLESDNIEQVLDITGYSSLAKYINNNIPVTDMSVEDIVSAGIDNATNEIETGYTAIVNLAQTPESHISGLSIIDGIVNYIVATHKVLSTTPRTYRFPDLDKAMVIKQYLDETLDTPDVTLTELTTHTDTYRDYIRNLTLAAGRVVDNESLVSVELKKYTQIQSIVSEIVVSK